MRLGVLFAVFIMIAFIIVKRRSRSGGSGS